MYKPVALILLLSVFMLLVLPATAQPRQASKKPKPSSAQQAKRHKKPKAPPIKFDEKQKGIEVSVLIKQVLRQKSPEERKKMVKELAKLGFLVDVPELWLFVDDPETIFGALEFFGEPYSPPMLDALERVYPATQNKLRRIQGAGLLYRYGRPSGRVYLVRAMQGNVGGKVVKGVDIRDTKKDTDGLAGMAATVLVWNREEELLPDFFKFISESSSSKREIVLALGDWKTPAVAQWLLEALEQDPEDAILALANAKQNNRAAVPIIQRQYKELKPWKNAWEYYAVALVKLNTPQSDQILAFLLEQLKKASDEGMNRRADVVEALAQVGEERAVPALLGLIGDYVENGVPLDKHDLESTTTQAPDLFVNAVEALPFPAEDSVRLLLTRMLLRMEKERVDSDRVLRVAKVLLGFGSSSHAVVEKVAGKRWLRQELAKQKLKPVPSYALLHESYYKDRP